MKGRFFILVLLITAGIFLSSCSGRMLLKRRYTSGFYHHALHKPAQNFKANAPAVENEAMVQEARRIQKEQEISAFFDIENLSTVIRSPLNCSDTIVLKNKRKIAGEVFYVSEEMIKYRGCGNDLELKSVPVMMIDRILLKNGRTEKFEGAAVEKNREMVVKNPEPVVRKGGLRNRVPGRGGGGKGLAIFGYVCAFIGALAALLAASIAGLILLGVCLAGVIVISIDSDSVFYRFFLGVGKIFGGIVLFFLILGIILLIAFAG